MRLWKHSRLRFYILNTIWNYKFWLFAKPMYKDYAYFPMSDEFIDTAIKIIQKKDNKPVKFRRFIGYLYNNNIHLDNPGLPNIDRETWEAWRKKRLF